MFMENIKLPFKAGDVVYVFYRNPHTQDVANIQEAIIEKNPENADELALFLYDTYYPLTNEVAVYTSEEEAKQVYRQIFENN